MKVIINSFLLSLLTFSCYSQNLISNGDFEIYDTLPDFNGQVQRALPWKQISRSCDYWYNTIWTPWFDNNQVSKSGSGFSGIGNSSNGFGCETFGQTLVSAIISGETYAIGAYCKNGSNATWPDNCSKLAFYGFANDPLADTILIRPSDLPDAHLLCETNLITNQDWELKTCTFIAPVNLNYIAVTLNGDCSQYVLLDSIFCYKTNNHTIVQDTCKYFMPDVFSPNNDGNNDYLKPLIECNISEYNLSIYNRWGALVFQTDDIHDAWNGYHNSLECEIGTYMYLLQFKDNKHHLKTKKGDIILIR